MPLWKSSSPLWLPSTFLLDNPPLWISAEKAFDIRDLTSQQLSLATLDCRLLYEPVSLPSKTNSGIYYTMHGPKKVTKCFSFRLPHTILVILRCQNIFSSKILCYSEFQNSVMFYLRQLSLATLDCRLLYEPVSLQCKTNLGIYYRKAPKKSLNAIPFVFHIPFL